MSRAKKMRSESVCGARDARSASNGRRAWYACWAASLVALLPGCGAEGYEQGEGEEDAQLAVLEQPITGGDLTNGAFPAVVRLETDAGSCTATKIGAFKFLTAAHCVEDDPEATLVEIVDVNGVERSLSIPAGGIQMHPSYALLEAPGTNGAAAARSFDVAVITTTTSTSTLPTLPLPASSGPVTQPITVTGVGFGCDDLVQARTGQQQSALFELDLVNGTHTMTDLGIPSACEGDSGGPGLSGPDNRIIGVMGQGVFDAQTFFQRMSSVRGWVNNPVPGNHSSLFQSGSVTFMHNRPATAGLLGLCMASSANSLPVAVQLSECSDFGGSLTNGRGPGWTILPTSTASRFLLVNSPTGGCLAAPNGAANANLRIETCVPNFAENRQQWSFTTTTFGGPIPNLRIKNRFSGLCVRSENNSTAHGTLVEQTPCDAATSTEFNSGQSWIAMR